MKYFTVREGSMGNDEFALWFEKPPQNINGYKANFKVNKEIPEATSLDACIAAYKSTLVVVSEETPGTSQ